MLHRGKTFNKFANATALQQFRFGILVTCGFSLS